jgi:hypothetical protein
MRVRKEPQNVESRTPERGCVTVLVSNDVVASFMFIADAPIRYAMMSRDSYRPADRKSPWRFAEFL